VRIAADDDEGRERLLRYCARPPLSLERILVLRDGRIAYRLKTPRKGRTHRVMEPLEFMARLAALLPPPKIPQIRYHGVFASSSSWRPLVTPKPRVARAAHEPCAASTAAPPVVAEVSGTTPATSALAAPAPLAPVSPWLMPPPKEPTAFEPWVFQGSGSATPTSAPWMFRHAAAEPTVEPEAIVDATRIAVKHWGRLFSGELLAKSRYIDWAALMKRTWALDVKKCERCGGRLRVLATITDPETIRKMLDHLHVRSSPLPRAPARDPIWEQRRFEYDAA
jgi:hypothetical protein